MNDLWGMDPEAALTMAARWEDQASRIKALRTDIDTRLADAEWQGPDATRFRSDWEGTFTASLDAAVETLTRHAAELRAAAIAQRTAAGG